MYTQLEESVLHWENVFSDTVIFTGPFPRSSSPDIHTFVPCTMEKVIERMILLAVIRNLYLAYDFIASFV